MSIRLVNAALDIFKAGQEGEDTLIIRGVLDPNCLNEILADTYQREIVSGTKISALAKAFKESNVPDIELGMRGEKHQERENGHTYILQDPTYVIDGLQRITAAKHLMQIEPGSLPRVGVLVHLKTTFEWEKARFRILNQERSRLSVNVLLRNQRSENPAIDMLYKLCEDPSFALKDRVCWAQNMLRTQIQHALPLCKVAGVLHSRFGPGRSNSSNELPGGLDKIMAKVGRTTMRENVKEFFELLDGCFGVRRIVFSHGASQIKLTFLLVLSDVLTRHDDFWRENKLVVVKELERKIAQFPIQDPEVARLCCAGGKAREILYSLLVDHINSGKRTRRLKLGAGFASKESLPGDGDGGEGE